LLHPVADAVQIILSLDEPDRDIRFVVENEVSLLCFAATDKLAAHDDPPLGETHLLANLQHLVPSRMLQGGQDELGANVAFGEALFIHHASSLGTDANELHHVRTRLGACLWRDAAPLPPTYTSRWKESNDAPVVAKRAERLIRRPGPSRQ